MDTYQSPLNSNAAAYSYIPRGTQVRLHFWSLHRDPRNFSDPDKFWPERWLFAEGLLTEPSDKQQSFTHNQDAFIPFSFGPYNCVGKKVAMEERRVVVCHTVQ